MESMIENKFIYTPDILIDYPFFKNDAANKRSFNALSIAFAIFNLEKKIRKERIHYAHIKLVKSVLDRDIINDLIDLLSFTLLEYVDFKFISTTLKFKKKKKQAQKKRYDAVCLFSGGADSYSGILNSKKHFTKIEGIFSAHSDQKKIIKTVNSLSEKILKHHGIDLFKLRAPSMGKEGYSQTRGFFYMLSAAAHMNLVGADKLIVCECGPTMYQPQFGPADTVTFTAHPVVIEITKNIISNILNKNIKIITPFEDFTKAEVISISPEKSGLKQTHSCITQRFGDHCGTCYGCIVRRLAGIAAGIQDVYYRKNPIKDENANAENLIPLLIFSQDVLLNFEEMEYYQRKNIETYQKESLFRRFALDNYAAIHKLISTKSKIIKSIRTLYLDTIEVIGAQILDERLEELKKGYFKPNYSPVFK